VTTGSALVVVLVSLVFVNVWVHMGPRRAHVVTGPLGALALLAVARAAGLSWDALGLSRANLVAGLAYGAAAAAAIALVYAVGSALPLTRRAFLDTRYRVPMRAAVVTGLVTIPLATVVFEEIAFRSVLWGLLEAGHGPGVATAVTSVIFGLWHVLPALDVMGTSTAISHSGRPASRRRVFLTVLGTVVFTAAAGVVFAELRRRSGSVVAPLLLHWATNGLAVVAASRLWKVSPPAPAAPQR
jgi:membrane protease YdiL (CAAX protease family)